MEIMGSGSLKEYQINIYNLSNKVHDFKFDINEKLFSEREYSLVSKGTGHCLLKLQKSETMMNLYFEIKGSVELICDRSMEPFDYHLHSKEHVIIKFGDSDYTLNDEVYVVRKDTPFINVADFIYEFISLGIPMKKLHPKFGAEEDEQEERIFYTSEDEEPSSKNEDEEIDPRWEQLKKLKK